MTEALTHTQKRKKPKGFYESQWGGPGRGGEVERRRRVERGRRSGQGEGGSRITKPPKSIESLFLKQVSPNSFGLLLKGRSNTARSGKEKGRKIAGSKTPSCGGAEDQGGGSGSQENLSIREEKSDA